MDSGLVILALCGVVLLSYFFEVTATFSKIPSVILLILLGFGISFISAKTGIPVLELDEVLPILGTFGLILIVLNESFDVQLERENLPMIRKSFIVAVIPMLVLSVLIAAFFYYAEPISWQQAIVNAIPLAIISSAVAIPSVSHLARHVKEFVVFESSLSDIFGVVLFNFFALNVVFSAQTLVVFFLQLALMFLISFVASVLLSYLLSKIEHPIKFVPIIVLVILIYEISKIYHLPALIFILLFGLFLGNLDLIKNEKINNIIKPQVLDSEVKNFKKIVSEATFLIRTLFFLVFGYLIELKDVLNPVTFQWALLIVTSIFIVRGVQLFLMKLPIFPLLFIAPRGLITILLFLSIPLSFRIPILNNSLILQVIILTVLVMIVGMLFSKRVKIDSLELAQEEESLSSFFSEELVSLLKSESSKEDTSE